MQRLWNIIISTKTAMLLLVLLIISIGGATFIENSFDTATAKLLIYNTIWFEILLVILIVLYIINLIKKTLFSIEKLPQFVLHVSFIVIIIGSGITRYTGFNANMHIRENNKSAVLYTSDPYLQIREVDQDLEYISPAPLYFSQLENNDFHLEFDMNGKLEIAFKDYIANTKKKLNNTTPKSDNEIVTSYFDSKSGHKPSVLILILKHQGVSKEVNLYYDKTKYIQTAQYADFGNLKLELVYGPKPISLPFSLNLVNFTLKKYPGSNIPSASESEVILVDERINLKENHVISKSKILDYGGYRFFQTSYDDDEKGTILSVNYDYYGTRITYLGYLMLIVGVLFVLFSKNSNYFKLDGKIKDVQKRRKAMMMTLFLVLLSMNNTFSQSNNELLDVAHADRFGHLITQTFHGRFSSVHSLATDVIHKISGKDRFTTPERGEMNAMQIFLDMHLDRDYWLDQKIIIIRDKNISNYIGISGKYASYNDLFENNNYKLESLGLLAFQKKATEQNAMEKEIIKVSERVHIFLEVVNGQSLKIFPVPNSINVQWVSWDESPAFKPITGELLSINDELQLPNFNHSNILSAYFLATYYAKKSNNYEKSDKIIGYIHQIQQNLAPKTSFPSKNKIEFEIFYNNASIFGLLKILYGLLGMALLVFVLVDNFKLKSSKKVQAAIKICVILFFTTFLYHTFGLGLRWYLSGHAPWSNGYEVLLFVSWGGILAGFFVIKYSKITLAATGVLAFIILMIAEHSYYDPQLTNLTPVLKSYWLLIHVAIITIGYSFLAISCLLGIINICIGLFENKKNKTLSVLLIEELTYTNEKLLTIGLFLTAIGSFIGGVWANESWGRYWGWDAKETWSLIIILIYSVVLHLKYIPTMKSFLTFNISSVISFGSVIMTFVGVNYYFKNGLHSYATDDAPIFPVWVWIALGVLLLLIIAAVIKERYTNTNQKYSASSVLSEKKA